MMTTALLLLVAIGVTELQPTEPFKPSEAWTWHTAPVQVDSGVTHFLLTEQETEDGKENHPEWIRLGNAVWASVPKKEGWVYRVAVYDKEGQRMGNLTVTGGDDGIMSVRQFGVMVGEAAVAGIEKLSLEARERIAAKASKEAKKHGLYVPPYAGDLDTPETWPEKWEFKLKLENRSIVTNDSFPGKIVIIDCWATWCSPCIALMPELTEFYKKHKDKVVIVSISYDTDKERAREVLRKFDVDKEWPLVFAPSDKEERDLWEKAFLGRVNAGVPQIIIVDRQGNMVRGHPSYFLKSVEMMLISQE